MADDLAGPTSSAVDRADPISRPVRMALLAILAIGVAGTGIELLLLKHTEDWWQWAPIVMLAVALVVSVAVAVAPVAAWVRTLQLLMLLFVVTGIVGTWLHYAGNVEWELERMASLSGMELFRAAMMGATPALAPGTMVQLGLIGLLYTYRHPALARRSQQSSTGIAT
jgi:hypothetical protein